MSFSIRQSGRLGSLWIGAALVVFAGWTALSIVGHLRRREPMPVDTGRTAPGFDEVDLRNVDYSSYSGGERAFRLRADAIVRRKVKLGPLTVNQVKEVEMTGVRIEIERSGAGVGEAADGRGIDLPIRSILEGTLSAKRVGLISRVVIRKLEVVFLERTLPSLTLQSGKASVGLRSDALLFDGGLTLGSPGGGRLSAQSAEWRPDGRRLVVHGRYTFEDARGLHRGEGASFRIGPGGDLTKD